MIRQIFAFIATFFANQWRQYTPAGQLLFTLGVVAIVVDVGIAYKYGVAQSSEEGGSRLHGAGFGLVAIAIAVLPDEFFKVLRKGNIGAAVGLLVAFVILAPVAFQSHVGYSAGIRKGDMQQTGVSQVKWDEARKSIDGERQKLAMLVAHKERVEKERAQLVADNPWAVTVTAEALRAEQKVIAERMVAEESGQRGRRKGRGAEFEKLQSSKVDLDKRLGSIDKLNEIAADIAKHTEMINASQAAIAVMTAAIKGSTLRSSAVVNQNDTFVKLVNMFWFQKSAEESVKADDVAREFVSTALAGTGSLAFLILGALFWTLAGFNRVEDGKGADRASRQPPPATVSTPAPTVHVVEVDRPVYVDRVVERPAAVERPRPVIAAPAKPRVVREYINASKDKLVDYRDAAMRSVRTA